LETDSFDFSLEADFSFFIVKRNIQDGISGKFEQTRMILSSLKNL